MSDRIVTHPATDAYREGWERTFGLEARLEEEMATYAEEDRAENALWSACDGDGLDCGMDLRDRPQ